MCVSIVCETTASGGERSGHVSVEVKGGGIGQSAQRFSYQVTINPEKGINGLARMNKMQGMRLIFTKSRSFGFCI